ncbi:hypothetical protein EPUS_07102 [Endocarpon pusillum Z07020]|uniref:Altered inheritance of mitochondria protein 21 n=1 Tax=Endocarpon pusillum (strain Z07020 / HMAS-L-300199) TaxID=1263415 RepID=U1GLA5_ENDPU|nr:uncharacterized protein EPUS_07102 [Endocarpon pusillum Z07020]ERF73008.1 hypothetical protein EPUS_07102 [Endocarpon pusillum Z07020]
MSTTAGPQIPPRPTRSQHAGAASTSRMPEIPPRPAHKRLDRSVSPSSFPHSPLYDPPSSHNLGRSISNDTSNLSLPPRPPSVTLPSIGQEGSEYADINYDTPTPAESVGPEEVGQMRNIGGDLKLHAPKPSLPQASAKAQVKAVTRTDDQQAAAHGFGKAGSPSHEESDPFTRSPTLRATSIPSGSQPSGPTSRRHSIAPGEEEQGPAELGLRVPINPNMGDVQAPSPAPFSALSDHHGPGKRRHHARTKSGREVYLPPGSYGLHGHGVPTHDKFDKDWYAKHPDQLLHEETIGHGHYSATGSGRGEWALSSDDLNKIVRNTASRGAGLGTNEGVMSYPDEQIGYLASDQYSSRIASPSQGGGHLHKLHSNSSQHATESPLRKTSFPAGLFQKSEFDKSKGSLSGRSDDIDSEAAEDDVIHVDDPARRYNKVTGGEETINELEDLGPNGGNAPDQGGYIDENGYGVPILASDEVAKDIGAEYMQPAISPKQERRSSGYYGGDDHASGNITPTSRPTSRPGSIHGFSASLSRYMARHEDREDLHTPLEDVDEYEPLFPDEDKNAKGSLNAADRFKLRPDTLKHRFPSQDIWEDTPSSAMHVATVSSSDVATQNESTDAESSSKTFEDSGAESARKNEVDEAEKTKLSPKEERHAKSRFAPHLRDDMPTRPNVQQRFPSRDIWEDTPDSMQLVTTVATPPPPSEEAKSPEGAPPNKPLIPPRPMNRSKVGEGSAVPSLSPSDDVKQPQVPARPPKRAHAVPPPTNKFTDITVPPPQTSEKNISPTEAKKGPSLPDRPKPQIPARPTKKESLEALTKTLSTTSSGSQDTVTSTTLPKPKPAIPVRPVGTKVNLPTAFMSDLNQRLQLGPRPPVKEKEPEPVVAKEALPLSDARKGRARGPQRRAPAKSPSSYVETPSVTFPKFSIATPMPLWSIGEYDGLTVHSLERSSSNPQKPLPKVLPDDGDLNATAAASARPADAPKAMGPTGLALNTAGDSADPSPMDSAIATPGTEKSDPLSKSIGTPVHENKEGFSSLSKQVVANSGTTGSSPLGRADSKNEETGSLGPDNNENNTVSAVEHGALSKASTARLTASGEPLQKAPAQEPHIGTVKSVGEDVLATNASAEPTSEKEMPITSVETSSRFENDDVNVSAGQGKESEHVGTGESEMRIESGLKTKIPHKKLEEMTATADGKGHAAEEEGSAKSG